MNSYSWDPVTGLLRIENFTYTYSFIEDVIDTPVYPSMYHYMSGLIVVWRNTGGFDTEQLVRDAYYEYTNLSYQDKIEIHEQHLVNLKSMRAEDEEKEHSAMNIVISDEDYPFTPFDPDSPIHEETMQFMRKLVTKYRKQKEEFERQIEEEEAAEIREMP
jgi:hypothetical protein